MMEFRPGEAVLILCQHGEVQARGIIETLCEEPCQDCGGVKYDLRCDDGRGATACVSAIRRAN